ncbi:unnamed protein product [Brassica oleracea var. botrytis]|uniref:(rape) hypothetical protein n=1 Tax=Brassica napus TaxID=3708 RepID=A0A816JF08_BRANA|nr:unnamed protein product [Brassica napus]
MRGRIQICYPHVILNCGSLDQHGFAMTIYLHEFLKSSLVDLHLKPSEEDLKQWPDTWPLNIDFFRKINSKPFRFLFAYHTYLAASDISSSHDMVFINYDSDDAVVLAFLTSLARKAQFQEVELEKQPSSSKRRLQSLANKRQDVKDMAEILPVRSARTVKSPRSLDSFGSSPGRQNGVNTTMFSNWNVTPVFGNGEASTEAHNENEWVEKDAPGVYIILTALASGVRDLKRVCFSRKVRIKRNSGRQITEEEYTNNTIYEWSIKPVRKCLTETLLPQPLLLFSQA